MQILVLTGRPDISHSLLAHHLSLWHQPVVEGKLALYYSEAYVQLVHAPSAITLVVQISPPEIKVEPGPGHPIYIPELACKK